MAVMQLPLATPPVALTLTPLRENANAYHNDSYNYVHLYCRTNDFYPFDITNIVKSWDDGSSTQHGLVARAINDDVGGSVATFDSYDSSNAYRHAYIQVFCN